MLSPPRTEGLEPAPSTGLRIRVWNVHGVPFRRDLEPRLGRIARRILADEGLSLPVARIYSEQRVADIKEHLNAGRVRLLDNRRQRLLLHARHVWRAAIPPAVGEDLNRIGPIRKKAPHSGARLAGRAGPAAAAGGGRRRPPVPPPRRCRSRRGGEWGP